VRPIDADAAQGEQPDEPGGPDDGDVGDVADEPAVVVDEVDDVPRPNARLADQPVGEVAEWRRRAADRRPRPSPAAAGTLALRMMTTRTTTASR
jgi:hypothetical protein